MKSFRARKVNIIIFKAEAFIFEYAGLIVNNVFGEETSRLSCNLVLIESNVLVIYSVSLTYG